MKEMQIIPVSMATIKNTKNAENMAYMVEHLPSNYQALSAKSQ
jgi:hypothetical protein